MRNGRFECKQANEPRNNESKFTIAGGRTIWQFIFMCLFAVMTMGCGGSSTTKDSPSSSSASPTTNPTGKQAADLSRRTADKKTLSEQVPSDIDETSVGTSGEAMSLRQKRLREAENLEQEQRLAEASQILRQQLLTNPDDTEVLFRIANLTASQGDLDSAISFLDSIPADNLEAGLPALGQAADWCIVMKRYGDAEDRYRKILEIVPDATIAHRRLALLLNRQGRRHEAAVHLRTLCKLGDVRQDELHALVVLSDAMGIVDTDDSAKKQQPTADQQKMPATNSDNTSTSTSTGEDQNETDYSPLNDWGRARILFTQRKYAEAAELLRDTCVPESQGSNSDTQPQAYPSRKLKDQVSDGNHLSVPESVFALYGRAVAESQQDAEFARWLQMTQQYPTIKEYSEYWAAIGTFLSSQQKAEPACRALLEGLVRDPTDFRSMNRLHQMLELVGRTEQAEAWEKRWKSNREILLANNAISSSKGPNVAAMDEIASQLAGLGRNVEAVLWKMLESFHRGQSSDVINGWNQERQQLVTNNRCFPTVQTNLCGMDVLQFPLPKLEELAENVVPVGTNQNAGTVSQSLPRFNDISNRIGVNHQYKLATSPIESGFAMYHQAGGGVAVLDYDHDGKQDLYFAQGGADAPSYRGPESNSLFRNQGESFASVTELADASNFSYTIGCTAGDWNQDGFPDLITANIGTNVLLLNNGDGTFTPSPIPGSDNLDTMPASLAIADLNGDSLPDLFETNYITDPELDMRPERDRDGEVIEAVGPADFQPAEDRIGLNDGTGYPRFTSTRVNPETIYRGLGLVVTDFDGDGLNEVFVGNDKSPNQLWKRTILEETNNRSERVEWQDIAMPRGVAFSFDGGGTASMGIASGDFDQSGSLDLHVANFQNENACLYLSQNEIFQDRAAQFRLGVPSYKVLGFGSQGLDFNLDGYLDLAVTNGHIDRYQKMNGDFLQKFQLFKNVGKRFLEVKFNDDATYTSTLHLGRAMAKCDFDNDGKEDLVITHINEPSVLLRNETKTDNRWVQIQLVGTKSERDAVGSKVTVKFDDQKLTQWVTSGDGYLCRNHNRLCFGLGQTNKIQSIQIDWPSGLTQHFNDSGTNQSLVIIEEAQEIFQYGK